MIGVADGAGDLAIVREFFELFKTPWEPCRTGKRYRVVVAAAGLPVPEADFAVVYGRSGVPTGGDTVVLTYRGRRFPVYCGCTDCGAGERAIASRKDTGAAAAVMSSAPRGATVRIGYDLFAEVRHLLAVGQPVEHAAVPTLEMHIAILRDLIVEHGIPLAEIPPVPAGRDLILCLTHDVDFAGLRLHGVDRTLLGFLYRASFGSLLRFLKGRLGAAKLLRNFAALLSLPLVYLGVVRDFFNQFEDYLRLEGRFRSTFFLVPYKDRDGESPPGRTSRGRRTRYDVGDISREIARLLEKGCEVGLHGLEAWRDGKEARREVARIRQATGAAPAGVRMHWLFWGAETPQVLEEAGLVYDSTRGYNDCVGFQAGLCQVYRLPGSGLFELPLHVQDTALFFAGRMGLNEKDGLQAIGRITDRVREHGGVLTVNWHDRSLGPERQWDGPYRFLLQAAGEDRVWTATAREVVEWFAARRSAQFECVELERGAIRVIAEDSAGGPGLALRVYNVPQAALDGIAAACPLCAVVPGVQPVKQEV